MFAALYFECKVRHSNGIVGNTVAAISCLIGDTMTKSISLPATGGTWEEAEVAIYSRDTRGYADFNLIVSEGDISLNYVEIIAEK